MSDEGVVSLAGVLTRLFRYENRAIQSPSGWVEPRDCRCLHAVGARSRTASLWSAGEQGQIGREPYAGKHPFECHQGCLTRLGFHHAIERNRQIA